MRPKTKLNFLVHEEIKPRYSNQRVIRLGLVVSRPGFDSLTKSDQKTSWYRYLQVPCLTFSF